MRPPSNLGLTRTDNPNADMSNKIVQYIILAPCLRILFYKLFKTGS